MPDTIIASRIPADATQRGHLEKLFTHPGFQLLRESVASRVAEHQVDGMNAELYETEAAKDKAAMAKAKAVLFRHMLEVLDVMSKNPDECYTIKLERR